MICNGTRWPPLSCYFGALLVLSSKLLICSKNSSKPTTPLLKKNLILLPYPNQLPTLYSWNEPPSLLPIFAPKFVVGDSCFLFPQYLSFITAKILWPATSYPPYGCDHNFSLPPSEMAGSTTALLNLLGNIKDVYLYPLRKDFRKKLIG